MLRIIRRLFIDFPGILTRLLQHDLSLAGYGLVIFDEFHERSLQADLGLAFARESQRLFRPDLRLLVMSATLDCAAVTRLLHDAPEMRVVVFGLEAGQEVPPHTVPVRVLMHVLQGKGVGVHAEFWPGIFGHDWPFWREAVRRFL